MPKKNIPLIIAEKNKKFNCNLDPNGFFIINTSNDLINVEFYENVIKENKIVSGKLLMVFQGHKADALSQSIVQHIKGLTPEHYIYLGRELILAEKSIKDKTKYKQS
jgi:hypothetical protein